MKAEDFNNLKNLIGYLCFFIVYFGGPKLGRYLIKKHPNSNSLVILFDDSSKGRYYFWIFSSLILGIGITLLFGLDFVISFIISMAIVMFGMARYFNKKGIYLGNRAGQFNSSIPIQLRKVSDNGNRINKYCSNHPTVTAMSHCNSCGKPYCHECLLEGNDYYYYCTNMNCQQYYYNKYSKTSNEIK